MRNITVSVPDEVYRQARIRAAERNSSVSALVATYLERLSAGDAEFERLADLQRQVLGEIGQFRGGDRVQRDEVHGRTIR